MAAIEAELQKAMSKEHLLEALLNKLNVSDATTKQKARTALIKALKGKNEPKFKEYITKLGGAAGEKAVDLIISRLFWILMKPPSLFPVYDILFRRQGVA